MKFRTVLIFLETLALTGLIVIPAAVSAAGLEVMRLKCEYKTNPLGIGTEHPRLSWEITSDKRGILQSAYELRAAENPAALKNTKQCLWATGKVTSGQSIHVIYEGPLLKSGQRAYWQVRIWDQKGKASAWSQPAFWEMGLLSPSDWKGMWIRPDLKEDSARSNPSPMLRHTFSVKGAVRSAKAYISALGLYEAHMNGLRIGDEVFTPGWTAYDSRVQYQSYDVTNHIVQGENAVGVLLGDGWYRGSLAWSGNRTVYGKYLGLLFQLEITYADGRKTVVVSDPSWKASTGPVLVSDIYNGETYDARLEMPGWTRAGFDDSSWKGVILLDKFRIKVVAPQGSPVRCLEEIKPVEILKTPAGETVVDMGQNMVGWIRLKVSGPAGHTVKLRHAEVLDREGNFYTENLRSAQQTIAYTLKGAGEEVYEPHFTFQGFRYVSVENYPGNLTLDHLTGVVIYSDIGFEGTFLCSDSMLNKLQHNIQWGQKGNFLDVPTDCPQRDERLGWTGDTQVFTRTACFNAMVAPFYTKWLKDLAADQKVSGAVPHVIPNILDRKNPASNCASAGWADAAVVVPWTVYLCYGDTRVLEEQYPSMKAWVDYQKNRAGDSYLWTQDFTFGDWLAFATTRSDYPGATTDKDLASSAYFARSTDLLQKTAAVLGKEEDAATYRTLLENIRKAFRKEYITPNGRLASNTQTAYSLALTFGLIPEDLKEKAASRLAEDVNRFKHITTGFMGTPLICHVLSENGYLDEAYMLLNRKQYPSWLYPITRGATTIWERWDGIKADGSFQDKGMNSFNHYAYGAIGEWMYRVVAGIEIDPENPGYRHTVFQPHPGGGLSFTRAGVHSMYGPVSADWKIENQHFRLVVEIPPNTTGTVRLPKAMLVNVTESGKTLSKADGISGSVQMADHVQVKVGSGKYTFEYPYTAE